MDTSTLKGLPFNPAEYHDLYYVNVGFMWVSTYVVFLLLAIFFKGIVMYIETKRLKLFLAITLAIFVLQIIVEPYSSRLTFLLAHKYFHHDLNPNYIFNQLGRVYLGGQIGEWLVFFLACAVLRLKKINVFKYLDVFFLGGIPSILMYRIGMAISHHHIGKLTTSPFGILYKGEIRHETSIYESVSLVILFAFAWLIRKKIKKPGFLTLVIIAWMSLSRFITDFFRRSDFHMNYRINGVITLNQVTFFILFLISFSAIVYLLKYRRREVLELSSSGES